VQIDIIIVLPQPRVDHPKTKITRLLLLCIIVLYNTFSTLLK